MPAALCPADETKRLGSLHRHAILDSPPDADFDIFPSLAIDLLNVPIAAISLVDCDRVWLKSQIGLGISELPRELSFCAHAILRPAEVTSVEDARSDQRFADNPLVMQPGGIAFYAGAPILCEEGQPLGTLCVIDTVPRRMSPMQLAALARLARGVANTLHLHLTLRRLQGVALTDPLTGIANRAGFETKVTTMLAARAAEGRLTGSPVDALLLLDLDSFKPVNDLFGHPGGDRVLVETAQRLVRVTRENDIVARLGGDEFAVFARGVHGSSEAQGIAQRLHDVLGNAFWIDGKCVALGASIGVAMAPEHGDTLECLMASADAALYVAKRAGKRQTRIAELAVEPAPESVGVKPLGREATQRALRTALAKRGEEPFTLNYQPFFDTQTGRLMGLEALLRWPQPGGSQLSPGDFIPVAESSGLIVQLDHWALRTACHDAARWTLPVSVAVNFSATNFFIEGLTDTILDVLAGSGLPPDRLKIEVTETVLLRERDRVRQVIQRLKNLGVRVVLDDFGAGHASLGYLRDFPFDEVKIDRSFVKDLEDDTGARAFVRAIVAMATALGMDTTAEGVETPGQVSRLKRKRVTSLQGYLLGRPMTGADVLRQMDGPAWMSPMLRTHAPMRTQRWDDTRRSRRVSAAVA